MDLNTKSPFGKFLTFATLVLTSTLIIQYPAHADLQLGSSAIQANLGFSEGGKIAIGAEFEYAMDRTFGVGGLFHIQQQSKKSGTTTKPAANKDGVTVIGGFIRPHFNRQNWDLFLSPGFALIQINPFTNNYDDETLLGPIFSYGVLYELNDKISVGMEHLYAYGWFGEGAYTDAIVSHVSAKIRFAF